MRLWKYKKQVKTPATGILVSLDNSGNNSELWEESKIKRLWWIFLIRRRTVAFLKSVRPNEMTEGLYHMDELLVRLSKMTLLLEVMFSISLDRTRRVIGYAHVIQLDSVNLVCPFCAKPVHLCMWNSVVVTFYRKKHAQKIWNCKRVRLSICTTGTSFLRLWIKKDHCKIDST